MSQSDDVASIIGKDWLSEFVEYRNSFVRGIVEKKASYDTNYTERIL